MLSIIAVLVALGGFIESTKYQQTKQGNFMLQQGTQEQPLMMKRGNERGELRTMGGEIISADDTTVTVRDSRMAGQDNSPITSDHDTKTASGGTTDLKAGERSVHVEPRTAMTASPLSAFSSG